MRICIKLSGRWLRSKHFLNGEEFDRIMLLILNSNSFSVYEDGKLVQEYNVDEVADQMLLKMILNILGWKNEERLFLYKILQ